MRIANATANPVPDGTDVAKPRVSVVIPMHNAERFIAAAIRSALDPSMPEVEVLVVDDGSTDNSVAEARAVADPRVRLIQILASGGPSRPRNIGIAQARAPYVSLLDSDDLLKPGKLASSVAALDRCPTAGLAFGDFEKIDADGNVYELSVMYAYPRFRDLPTRAAGDDWRLVPQEALARGLLYENFIGTSGVVVRSSLAKAVGGFDETLPNSNDRDLWFRLAHTCDALFSSRVGHSYRVHSESIIHGPPIRNAVSRIAVLRREKARWSDRDARRQLNRLIADNYAAIGYHERRQQLRLTAMRSFLHAFLVSHEGRWLVSLASTLFAPESEA
jgi:glycosyltransferase involved in cell wall biosynthesis